MTHWLNEVATVLDSDTVDLPRLATLVEADPRTFYVGTRLDGVNVCGQDLRGMQFTEMAQAAIIFDRSTQLDPKHWSELILNRKATFVIRHELFGRELSPELTTRARDKICEVLSSRSALDQATSLLLALVEDRDVGILIARKLSVCARRDD